MQTRFQAKIEKLFESDVNALIEEGYEPAQCCVDNLRILYMIQK